MKDITGKTAKNKKDLISKVFLIIAIPLFIITFFQTYNSIFDEKIDLNGDNSSYYMLGNSLQQGLGFTNIHIKEMSAHNHFPPGYPVILAGLIQFFSNDITTLKKANGFFFFISIALIFLLCFRLCKNYYIPLMVSLLILFNANVLTYSFIMMSEIPFIMLSVLSLWLMYNIDFSKNLKNNWVFWVLIITVTATYYIRSTGLALVGALTLFLIYKRNWKYLISFLSGFVLMVIPWYLRSSELGGNAYMKQLIRKNPYKPELGTMELLDWPKRFWINFERYLTREIPSGMFNFIKVENYSLPITSKEWFVGILILSIICFGLYRLKKSSLILVFYVISSFGILLLWPDVWFGVRFLLPLLPIIILMFVLGIAELIVFISQKFFNLKNPAIVLIGLTIITALSIKSYSKDEIEYFKRKADAPYMGSYKNFFEIAKWVKKNTADTSITASRKGNLFYLYSNKYVSDYRFTPNNEEQIEYLKERNVDYVVLDQLGYSSTARYLYPAIQRYPEKFKVILHLKNPDTYLLKFQPEMGYWGEWKDNVKHGYGSYSWENGSKFEGQWENNLKNGKGKLYMANGQYLEGVWTNDVLSGVVLTKDNNNQIIEKAVYDNNQKVESLSID